MHRLSVARHPLVLAAFGLAMGCGGSVQTAPTDGGAPGAQNGSARTDSGRGASSSTPGGQQGSDGSNGSSLPGIGPTADDAGCSGGLPYFYTTDAVTNACLSCIAKGCASEMAACGGDCACSAGFSAALGCVNNASDVGVCFIPASGDLPALSAVDLCISKASLECGCGNAPDASSACVPTGGGGGESSGQCTSNAGEMCGSASYQVVCACPQGSCACFSDTSTTIIKISSCPYCPGIGGPGQTSVRDLLDLCGFPR